MDLSDTAVAICGIRAELNGCVGRLDASAQKRSFLRDLFRSLPDDLQADLHPEARVRLTPQYRALPPDAKRAVEWAPLGRGHLFVPDADMRAAHAFWAWVAANTDEDDELQQHARNAESNLAWFLNNLEEEREALRRDEERMARAERRFFAEGEIR